jgi:hypothetical protein
MWALTRLDLGLLKAAASSLLVSEGQRLFDELRLSSVTDAWSEQHIDG